MRDSSRAGSDTRPGNSAMTRGRLKHILVVFVALISLLGGGVTAAEARVHPTPASSSRPSPQSVQGNVKRRVVKRRVIKRRRRCPKGTHRSKAHRPKGTRRHPCIRNHKVPARRK